MTFLRLIFITGIVIKLSATVLATKYSQDVMEASKLDTEQLIRKYNYPVETHFITTDDGYILRCHRIPKPGGKPYLLVHGLLDSSITYVLMGPKRSLGFFLHDRGYDVWMCNVRGNRYSRNHTTLNPEKPEFWVFSWHEIGMHDIPAMIDYILEKTKFPKLTYVGHSQGTTVIYVLLSMKPKYNEKIIKAHCLAPVAYTKHISSPLLSYRKAYLQVLASKSHKEVLSHSDKFKNMCLTPQMEAVCINVVFMIMGKSVEQFDKAMFPMMMGNLPAGCSAYQLEHYSQGIDSGEFRQFDYGKEKNQKKYGQSVPPKYDLKKVTCPMAMYYTKNDYLADPRDVKKLIEELSNKPEVHEVGGPQWNHMDPLYAKDVVSELYSKWFK